jgi:hypothetical protein
MTSKKGSFYVTDYKCSSSVPPIFHLLYRFSNTDHGSVLAGYLLAAVCTIYLSDSTPNYLPPIQFSLAVTVKDKEREEALNVPGSKRQTGLLTF